MGGESISPQGPSTEDIAQVTKLDSQIQQLKSAKNAAKVGQKSQVGKSKSPKKPLGNAAKTGQESQSRKSKSPKKTPGNAGSSIPVMDDYAGCIQKLIGYLIDTDHIPKSALQGLLNTLAGISPLLPNAASQYSELLHQVCALGVAIDPNFVKILEGGIGSGVSDANAAVKSLQSALQGLIDSLGPEGAVVRDMLAIQSWLANYPNNIGDAAGIQNIAAAVQDLASHTNDPAPWGNAVTTILGSLNQLKNGMSFADILGTLIFFNIFKAHANGDDYQDATDDMAPYLKTLEDAFHASGSPFLTNICAKIDTLKGYEGWKNSNYVHYMGGPPPTCYEIIPNFDSMIASLCGFSQSAVNTASATIGQTIANVSAISSALQEYAADLAALNSVQQSLKSFTAVAAGNWQQAFPSGPYQQSGDAPPAYTPGLSALFSALFQIFSEKIKSTGDPGGLLTSALKQLISIGTGPPYPSGVLKSLQIIVATAGPLSKSQQTLIQNAYSLISKEIANDTTQKSSDQKTLDMMKQIFADMSNIETLLKSLPNLSTDQWESLAGSFADLMTLEAGAPSAAQASILTVVNMFQSAMPIAHMAEDVGYMVQGAFIKQGHDSSWIANWRLTVAASFPGARSSAFLTYFIVGMATKNPDYATATSDLNQGLAGSLGSNLLSSMTEEAAGFSTSILADAQNAVKQDAADIAGLQSFQSQMKQLFPFVK